MLYSIVRCVFCVLIVIIATVVLLKCRRLRKTGIVLLVVLCLVVCSLPFENLFVTFQTPEEVFAYSKSGDIIQMVENENSSAVIYQKEKDAYSIAFMIKKNNGYQISSFFSTKREVLGSYKSVAILLYNVRGTSDFYLYINGFVEQEITIQDNLGTIVQPIYDEISTHKIAMCLVPIAYDSDYELYINGTLVTTGVE